MTEPAVPPAAEIAPPAPYVAPEANLAELSARAIVLGMIFGVIFGAATVYLALKAGLTVSASIPVPVSETASMT